jgi:hypothetical protein
MALADVPSGRRRPAPRRLPRPTQRRALELLADAGRDGVAEGLMLANGTTIETMVALVRAGLATATPQRTRAGREVLEVATLQISDEGQQALTETKS